MENKLIKVNDEIVSKLVLEGDLSKMTSQQKTEYYNSFCNSLGLNPLTQPFQLIVFQGKQRMYATKDCTEQLRKIHGVSITDITTQEIRGVFVVTAKALDREGKTDAATGAVTIEGLKGDALANALMKAETKAKRRVTLSICGLGMLDESEAETIPGAVKSTIEDDQEIETLRDLYSELLTEDVFNEAEILKFAWQKTWNLERLKNNYTKLKAEKEKRLSQLYSEHEDAA